MMTFDTVLPTVVEILQAHHATVNSIQPIMVNRDLHGRIRLVIAEKHRLVYEQAIASIARALSEQLGNHAFHEEQVILFEADVDAVKYGATCFPLQGVVGVSVIDRLATETSWATITPISTNIPRVVFYSIKGGVGRSTAIAATAWSLAEAGKRVLVLDLDLESPGLSSALLPNDRRPMYGIADWLVEDLVDNEASVFNDLYATSTLSREGEIYVVPAHGKDPGEYIAKLGRVWMPKINAEGVRVNWSNRLQRLIQKLETHLLPDVVLIDSRSGIDEIASSCVTDLGATLILLFAIEGEQTWLGYRMLFDYWHRAGVVQDIREQLQLVGAMIPEIDAAEYVRELNDHGWDLFAAALYDEIPSQDLGVEHWSFDTADEMAPHYPWSIRWHRGFSALRSLHARFESIDPIEVQSIFGPLIDGIKSIISESDRHD